MSLRNVFSINRGRTKSLIINWSAINEFNQEFNQKTVTTEMSKFPQNSSFKKD